MSDGEKKAGDIEANYWIVCPVNNGLSVTLVRRPTKEKDTFVRP